MGEDIYILSIEILPSQFLFVNRQMIKEMAKGRTYSQMVANIQVCKGWIPKIIYI